MNIVDKVVDPFKQSRLTPKDVQLVSQKINHATKNSVPDPWHFGVDPDPAIFVTDLQDASKKLIFEHIFFCLLLFEGTRYIYIIFQR